MAHPLVEQVEKAYLKKEAIPDFSVGDTVDVATKIVEGLEPIEVSIGDYVLSGGELAAMVVIDAVVRLLPGALGAEDGAADETFTDGLLEHPQYTRPREYRGMSVPDVLLSGNHAAIAAWRLEQRKKRTAERRPDLWSAYQDKQK